MEVRNCELCDAKAAVFCPSDAAFLCWACDARVHQANFLVARHFRHPLIVSDHVGGGEELDSLSSSNTSPEKNHSSIDQSADSSSSTCDVNRHRTNRSVDYMKMEDIFANWSAKLGLSGGGELAAVRIACSTLKACFDRWKVFPLRVCLAVSMWIGMRAASGMEGDRSAVTTRIALKRVEDISGVPAKLILVAESRLGQALRSGKQRLRRHAELEEGWAEC